MTDDWERLLRCSLCGDHNWSCEEANFDNTLGKMCLHLTCKNCHAHFRLSLGSEGIELRIPADQADQDYLLYTLREMHDAQARLSRIFTPPYMPREAEIRAVLDRVCETIDAMTGYTQHLETGKPLSSPLRS